MGNLAGGDLVLSTGLIMLIGKDLRDSKADVSRVSSSSEQIEELWVLCGLQIF